MSLDICRERLLGTGMEGRRLWANAKVEERENAKAGVGVASD